MQKLLHAFLLFILSTVAFGQGVVVSYPPAGTSVKRGDHIRVQIDRPDSLSSSFEIGVGIAIAPCGTRPCFLPEDFMGYVLYHGGYNPVLINGRGLTLVQNFSVEVPSTFPTGPAQLNIAHATLIGAGSIPYTQTLNTSLIVV
ncbi:hypothetical protein APHAL10511_008708 [Amanita phalloides]|nr:hypothetical protein APHAL10511_008708 [Amanita phalloides]